MHMARTTMILPDEVMTMLAELAQAMHAGNKTATLCELIRWEHHRRDAMAPPVAEVRPIDLTALASIPDMPSVDIPAVDIHNMPEHSKEHTIPRMRKPKEVGTSPELTKALKALLPAEAAPAKPKLNIEAMRQANEAKLAAKKAEGDRLRREREERKRALNP